MSKRGNKNSNIGEGGVPPFFQPVEFLFQENNNVDIENEIMKPLYGLIASGSLKEYLQSFINSFFSYLISEGNKRVREYMVSKGLYNITNSSIITMEDILECKIEADSYLSELFLTFGPLAISIENYFREKKENLEKSYNRSDIGSNIGSGLGAFVGGPIGAIAGAIIGSMLGSYTAEKDLQDEYNRFIVCFNDFWNKYNICAENLSSSASNWERYLNNVINLKIQSLDKGSRNLLVGGSRDNNENNLKWIIYLLLIIIALMIGFFIYFFVNNRISVDQQKEIQTSLNKANEDKSRLVSDQNLTIKPIEDVLLIDIDNKNSEKELKANEESAEGNKNKDKDENDSSKKVETQKNDENIIGKKISDDEEENIIVAKNEVNMKKVDVSSAVISRELFEKKRNDPFVGKYIDRLLSEISKRDENGFYSISEFYRLLEDERIKNIYYNEMLKIVNSFTSVAKKKSDFSLVNFCLKPEKIDKGKEFLKRNSDILDKVKSNYNVDPEYITAVLMVESDFCSVTGEYQVVNIFLSHILFMYDVASEIYGDALDPKIQKKLERRIDNAIKNLSVILKVAKQKGVDPLTIKGSYAGAIGCPQFMPSSFNYAVDGDNDGTINLFSLPDAIASIANYLQQHGYSENIEKSIYRYNPDKEFVECITKYVEEIKSLEN